MYVDDCLSVTLTYRKYNDWREGEKPTTTKNTFHIKDIFPWFEQDVNNFNLQIVSPFCIVWLLFSFVLFLYCIFFLKIKPFTSNILQLIIIQIPSLFKSCKFIFEHLLDSLSIIVECILGNLKKFVIRIHLSYMGYKLHKGTIDNNNSTFVVYT